MDEWSYACGDFWKSDDPFLDAFQKEGNKKSFHTGNYLIRQGDTSDRIFLLTDGCVHTSSVLPNGYRKIDLLYAGRVVLGLASLNDIGSEVSIQCLSPVSVICANSKAVSHWPPSMLLQIAMCQTWKMQIVYRQLRDSFFLPMEEQVEKAIHDMNTSGMIEKCHDCRLRQTILAELLGISRTRLSTILGKLAEEEKLTIDERAFLSMGQRVSLYEQC